mmetsp:Transcript_6470/g.11550  ORF Transcript_6470/g.11550 Transcript_6470/m.11550 type:complete len:227 (-) Transcript_6470:125-805(-)
MTAPGYETIGMESGGVEGVRNYGDEGELKGAGSSVEAGYQTIADSAGGAVQSAKEHVASVVHNVQGVNIYTEPINPTAEMSIRDRITLIAESARPWKEFIAPSTFSKPQAGELGVRFHHNLETFFYNYLILGLGFLLLLAIIHPFAVLSLFLVCALGLYLYVQHSEPISFFNGKFTLDTTLKHVVTACAVILALFVGNVGGIIVSVACFSAVVVGVHALFHSHENY